MNRVDLRRAKNWAQVINSLPSLLELHINYCGLDFMSPLDDANITTSLKLLDLSSNALYLYHHPPITTPTWIFRLTNLLSLDISVNDLLGPIPTISNATKLQHIDLSDNRLNSTIPDWLYLCKDLKFVDLSSNLLDGTLSDSIGKLSSLEELVLYDNKFTGTLPGSLGQLFNLQVFYISENMMEGVVTETHFSNLTKLETLSASGNHLTLQVSPNWNPPFQLKTLRLASWNFGVGSQIPSWLESQKNINNLDLSNTGISGSIPSWVWRIRILTLSHNHLYGNIPYLAGPNNQYIYLGSNQFRGSLPRIADTVEHLDLSNNSFSGGISHLLCHTTNETYKLELLHLGGNQLRGELPDCWMKWPSLIYLNLGNNNMSGSIPKSMGHLANLQSLNLFGNRLSGEIPFSMYNCTKLVKMDVGDNDLDGGVPTWVGTDQVKLAFLILRSNKLSGKISAEICHLSSLQILDLSDNKLSGTIPRCFGNFTAMATRRRFARYKYSYSYYLETIVDSVIVSIKGSKLEYGTTLSLVTDINLSKNNLSGDIPKELTRLVELRSLNLSRNRLTGLIPDGIADMKQLESLDLSRNSVSGQIPSSFALLSSLNHLNLSHNNLTGRIPESTQLQSLDASSFIGNNLCGPPLTINCIDDGDEVDGREDEGEIEWFYVLLSLGYAVGFSVVCTTLVLKKAWREAYFGGLECMWNEFYVYFHIKWVRLTKPYDKN
ncbi:hypothetical protein ACS0TY_035830 [Phlomoides rotata]